MTYDPNVFGYVDGQPTYSRDEFIYKKRRRGPITDDAELVAFAEKVTSGWYNAGWHQTFTTYYLGDYALSEPLDSMTIKEYNRSGHQDARGLLRRDARQLHTAPGPAQVAPLRPPCEAGPRPQEIPQPHPAGLLRCAGFGRRWELVKFKCVGCGLYWNVSIYQQIPRGGYICPHCESRLRAGETLPNQRPGQNDRPQTTKGAKP